MNEMYEIAQEAKYMFLGDKWIVKIGDGWNVRN